MRGVQIKRYMRVVVSGAHQENLRWAFELQQASSLNDACSLQTLQHNLLLQFPPDKGVAAQVTEGRSLIEKGKRKASV